MIVTYRSLSGDSTKGSDLATVKADLLWPDDRVPSAIHTLEEVGERMSDNWYDAKAEAFLKKPETEQSPSMTMPLSTASSA